MSAMVKLVMEIEESASEVTGNGMVFHLMTYSRDKVVESNALSLLSRPADCRMQVGDVSFEERVGDMVKSMRLIPTTKVSTDHVRVYEAARETTFRSVKGSSYALWTVVAKDALSAMSSSTAWFPFLAHDGD